MMLWIFLCVFTIVKAEHITSFERAELVSYNEDLLQNLTFKFGKYNRTMSGLNVSALLIRDLGKDLSIYVSGDRFYHNEYRPTGQKFSANLCHVWRVNMFAIPEMFRKAGWTMNMCDAKKGFYKVTNFMLNSNFMPPYMPSGQWRINVSPRHGEFGDIMDMQWYLDVKPV